MPNGVLENDSQFGGFMFPLRRDIEFLKLFIANDRAFKPQVPTILFDGNTVGEWSNCNWVKLFIVGMWLVNTPWSIHQSRTNKDLFVWNAGRASSSSKKLFDGQHHRIFAQDLDKFYHFSRKRMLILSYIAICLKHNSDCWKPFLVNRPG
ncbi:hypothetical protein QE152_g24921 [Popillia japonica]|uniref:Uncharacterized protein n=1 Tax=Popillia japonica TaxID=7064 RepID=A0AAW1K512_POPJA